MATNLAPFIRQQFFDNNGDPLSGGKIHTYQSGTTTPQETYTDASGATPHSNPVILDSSGSTEVWLDVDFSYKFVITDSNDNQIKVVDGVVGLATNNSVSTNSIQDVAVTEGKIADDAVTAAKLRDDASIDANRAVTTNHIRNSAVTNEKLASSSVTLDKLGPGLGIFFHPTIRKFTSGSGTYGLMRAFVVSSANATAGATYTNNSETFTVHKTISGATVLYAYSTGTPTSSGTLTKASGTGDTTISFTMYKDPVYLKVRLAGGGGGGSGSNTNGGAGGSGTATTFGSSLLTANGGTGGVQGAATGGAGGTVTVNSPAIDIASQNGTTGSGYVFAVSAAYFEGAGPFGGDNPGFNGAGRANGTLNPGAAGRANTGGGGQGGALNAIGSLPSGTGGGSGGYIEAIIPNPSSSYAYSVGSEGSGGSAGTSAYAGGAGGSGVIIIEEQFQ